MAIPKIGLCSPNHNTQNEPASEHRTRPRANLERSDTESFAVVLGCFRMGCFNLVIIGTIIKKDINAVSHISS